MTLWYVARAAGLVALAALTLATALGAFASIRQPGDTPSAHRLRFLLQYVHRAAAVTGLMLVTLHLATLLLDSQSGIDLRAVFIPFTSTYRPLAVGLGSLTLFTVIFVALLGTARGRLASSPTAARLWRPLHLSAYVAWVMAMTHGFFAGTDSEYGPIRFSYFAALLVVAVPVSARLWTRRVSKRGALTRSRDNLARTTVPPVRSAL